MKQKCILLVLVLFLSCAKEKKVATSYNISFKRNKEMSFNNKGYYYSFLSQIDSENNLVYRQKLRTGVQGIDIYSTANPNDSVKELRLSSKHLKYLKDLRGFFYKNKDSLFLIGLTKIIIINAENKIIFDEFFNPPEKNNYYSTNCSDRSRPFIYNNKLYFTRIIDLFPDNEMYNSNTLVSYNYKSKKTEIVPSTSYSSTYYDKCWVGADLDISNTLNVSDELLISYPVDDSIYVHSLIEEKITNRVIARSKYKNKETKSVNCDNVWLSKTYRTHVYESYLYLDIIYDSYRNIYYRIVQHPRENYDLKENYNSLLSEFSIMVLDKDLNVIYESEILNKTPKYINFDYFVDKDGLWMSTNNPDNSEYDENKLSFELFELKPL